MAARHALSLTGDNHGSQPQAKRRRLSAEARREIIAQCAAGDSQVEVASRYKVTKSCVSKIVGKRKAGELNLDGGKNPHVSVGRPRKLTPGDELTLVEIAEGDPFGSAATYSDRLLKKCQETDQPLDCAPLPVQQKRGIPYGSEENLL